MTLRQASLCDLCLNLVGSHLVDPGCGGGGHFLITRFFTALLITSLENPLH